MSDQKDVEIDYTNWRGERRWRPIRPISLNFESNEWHQNSQWLLEAIDLQDGQTKTFSMATVHGWSELAAAQVLDRTAMEKAKARREGK
jgi:predicted DNA-binding transcriptional regulator YafY